MSIFESSLRRNKTEQALNGFERPFVRSSDISFLKKTDAPCILTQKDQGYTRRGAESTKNIMTSQKNNFKLNSANSNLTPQAVPKQKQYALCRIENAPENFTSAVKLPGLKRHVTPLNNLNIANNSFEKDIFNTFSPLKRVKEVMEQRK